MIYTSGISISFLLGLLLLTKKDKTQADNILTCWLFVIAIHLLLFYLYFSKESYQYPFLLALDMPLPLIHGPFLFLYTASLTNQLTVKKTRLLLHFVPVAICYSYLVCFFYFLPQARKVYVFQHEGVGFEMFSRVNLVTIVASGITYIIWSSVLLRRYRISIIRYFSYTEKVNLKWLQYLVYGLSGIWILIFFDDQYIFGGVVLFILFVGYFGIKQAGIFTYQNLNPHVLQPIVQQKEESILLKTETVDNLRVIETLANASDTIVHEQAETVSFHDDNLEKKKYSKSGLTIDMAEQLHIKLTNLMKTEKVYRESELFLCDLANRLDTLPNYLSQVINEKEGKNFYDYINTLRIEEFKRLIAIPENKNYTILSLSYECGFNSKSSFNKNFKKATGQSPSEYMNSLVMETV